MRSFIVHIKELDRDFSMIAPNIFDAAIFTLGEQNPGWIRAVCCVTDCWDKEKYEFRATSSGDRVEFEFGN